MGRGLPLQLFSVFMSRVLLEYAYFLLSFDSNGSPMYKSLTETKKYSELEAHESLKRVASANAIIKPYKSSSLITVKRHAMVLSFFKS